jgi:hypothetical protein
MRNQYRLVLEDVNVSDLSLFNLTDDGHDLD